MVRSISVILFLLTSWTSGFHIAPSTPILRSSRQAARAVLPPTFVFSSSSLHMNDVAADSPPDPLILDTSRVLGRVSWLSWWAQVILSVVASVTLLFARNVTTQTNTVSSIGPGFILAGAGIVSWEYPSFGHGVLQDCLVDSDVNPARLVLRLGTCCEEPFK